MSRQGLEGRALGGHVLGGVEGRGRKRNLEAGGFTIEAGPKTEVEQGDSSWRMETWSRSQVQAWCWAWLSQELSLEKGQKLQGGGLVLFRSGPEAFSVEMLAHSRRCSRK